MSYLTPRLIHLKQSARNPEYWTFNILYGQMIINGFTYSSRTGSILLPRRHNTGAVISAPGIFWKRLRPIVEREISLLD